MPVTYVVDIHPTYQAGIDIEKIAAEGFGGLAVKVSQGTSTSAYAGARDWLDRGDRAGLVTYGYHYLTTANALAQASAAKLAAAGRPVMLDAEEGSGDVANVRAFLAAAARIGLRVPLVYCPRWWWDKVGGGSLAGLTLVASHYVSGTGYASTLYTKVPASWWDGYGGGTVALLQFSDRATVAGRQIDVNAFRGTPAELRALVYGDPAATPVSATSAPAAPAAPATRTDLVLANYPITGSGALELNAPIKGASAPNGYGQAFVSVRATAPGGSVDVYWGWSEHGGRGEAHWAPLAANERRWTELAASDGVDQCTVLYALGEGVTGVVTLEMFPK